MQKQNKSSWGILRQSFPELAGFSKVITLA
jgi:hypothetical protein